MTAWEALLLGVIQGATEFLPVSSSGHLVIGQALLGLSLPGITFEVVVHVATLLSVIIVYRERLLKLLRGALLRDPDSLRYVGLLALATLPVVVIGLGFGGLIEALFQSPIGVGVALLGTGGILFSTRSALARGLDVPVGVRAALLIGLAQCVALVPGISRSGTTVAAALWLGMRPAEAAAFSFLMSLPAISGAAILQLPELGGAIREVGALSLVLGFVAAAGTGVLAIRLFNRMLRNHSFPHFAWYCWGAGSLFLGWLLLGGS